MLTPGLPKDLTPHVIQMRKTVGRKTERSIQRLQIAHMTTPETGIDRKQAFLLYATLCGDVERTAAALNVSAVTVLRVADEENWAEKIKTIVELKKSSRPGDVERAVNRALNFVQACRMRLFIERLLQKLTNMSDAEVEEYIFSSEVPNTHGRPGNTIAKLNTRPVADLVAALEKVHAASYMALGDTTSERVKRQEFTDTKGGDSASEIHAKIALAMNEIAGSESPRALLFDAQLKEAQVVEQKVKVAKNKDDAYNDDTH